MDRAVLMALTDDFSLLALKCVPLKRDYIKWVITLTVITLSGFHCTKALVVSSRNP